MNHQHTLHEFPHIYQLLRISSPKLTYNIYANEHFMLDSNMEVRFLYIQLLRKCFGVSLYLILRIHIQLLFVGRPVFASLL